MSVSSGEEVEVPAQRVAGGGRSKRSRVVLIASITGIVAIVLACLAVGLLRGRTRAIAGDDPVALAKFLRTPEFNSLPAEQRVPYMQSVRKQLAPIEAAHREGKLPYDAYRDATFASWVARRFEDMQDYYKLAPAKRRAWLDRQSEKHAKKMKAAAASGDDEEDDDKRLYPDGVSKADVAAAKDEFQHQFVRHMTPDDRRQWEEFRTVYKQHRDRASAAAAAQKAASTAPTKPVADSTATGR